MKFSFLENTAKQPGFSLNQCITFMNNHHFMLIEGEFIKKLGILSMYKFHLFIVLNLLEILTLHPARTSALYHILLIIRALYILSII